MRSNRRSKTSTLVRGGTRLQWYGGSEEQGTERGMADGDVDGRLREYDQLNGLDE